MSSGGSFPLDIVLFAMIAGFLVLRLRSILGRRTGFERPPEQPPAAVPPGAATGRAAGPGPVLEGVAEPLAAPRPARPLPDPASPAGQGLARIARVEPGFDAAHFLEGAEAAFRIIVTAFAQGDRNTLKPLLSADTFAAFDAAISARESASLVQHTELKAILAATIEAADVRGTIADITVRFVSDQINRTVNASGQVVEGTEAVTEIHDLWTFERELGSPDPTWRLVAARSA